MTAFVESCAKTVTGSAKAVARRSSGRPKARQLIRLLSDKKRILITGHASPDPDAMASCQALCALLSEQLRGGAEIKISFKGFTGGGLNEAFTQLTNIQPLPWDEGTLGTWDAIVLMDTQPTFAN